MKIYLSGPMKGLPEDNFPSFEKATLALRTLGHQVSSPHELGVPRNMDVKIYAQTDLPELISCQAIAMLPDWEKSKGASAERAVAKWCGLEIYYYDEQYTNLLIKPTILQTAAFLVDGPRQASYGHPREDFERTAGMLRALFGWDVRAADIPDMMIALKLSRRRQSPSSKDHLIDIAGYARTAELLLK